MKIRGVWAINSLVSAVLMILLDLSQAFSSPQLSRFPYVQRPATSSVTIVWETDMPASCDIEYGLTPDLGLRMKSVTNNRRHEAELKGLRPNTEYFYRISAAGVPLMNAGTFKTSGDEATAKFSFVVFGDSGTGDQNQSRIATQMLHVHPNFGLVTGDIVYPSGAKEDYKRKYFVPYRDIISSICFYTTMGNHDYYTDKGSPYISTFVLPANNPSGSEKYYSFDYGNAHLICIDSNLPAGGEEEREQFKWLKSDLVSSKKLWKFVFMHHPPYSAGRHGSDMRIRKRYCPLFEEYSVDIVFSGHDHNYQRTERIREFLPAPEASGVIYIVTGGGGGGLYDVKHVEWTAFAKKAFHFVHVKVSGSQLDLSAIDDHGNEFDTISIEKQRGVGLE